MSKRSINTWYEDIQRQIRNEVDALDERSLNRTSVDEWVEYFVRKHALRSIVLLPEPPKLDNRVEMVHTRDRVWHEPITVERVTVLVELPIEDNEHISDLLNSRASSWLMNPPKWTYRNGYVVLETYRNDGPGLQREVETVKDLIARLNAEIEQNNNSLPSFIRSLVQQRMQIVGARAQQFQSLAEALGAELKLTPGTERRLQQVPRMKKAIAQLRRPQPQQKRAPRMDRETFQTILAVIDGQGISYERTPVTVAKLGEEDIRNLILGALNGAFNLDATGETFSKRGKTDIRLNVPEGGIFIAEAKMWGGPKTVSEALEQILGYLTWRDAYGVVLLFSRNKGFSKVRADIPEAIKGDPSLRGEVYQVDQHHWSARHVLPDDDFQTVEIHYLAYTIYSAEEAT